MNAIWTDADLRALDRKFAEAGIKPHARPLRAAMEILGHGFSMFAFGSPEVEAITAAYRALFPHTSTTWPGAGTGIAASVDEVRKVTMGVVFGSGQIQVWRALGFESEQSWWSWCREDVQIAGQSALAFADLHDFINGVDAVGPTHAEAAVLWNSASGFLSDMANILPSTSNLDGVIQPLCALVEVSLKASLRFLGKTEKETWGHGLVDLASDLATMKPHRDDGLITDAVKHLPKKYPDYRYKSLGLMRLNVVRLALAAQFVAASSVRRLSSVDLALDMESDSWPGARQPFLPVKGEACGI